MRLVAAVLAYAPLLLLAATACGGSIAAGTHDGGASADDGGPVTTGTGGGGATCTGGAIAFDLTVNTTDPVYFGGGQPPWPTSQGCPEWLTITAAGAPLVVTQGDCFVSCPAFQPESPAPQSFTWNGTYYPVADNACDTPACAAPGNYVATFCVGYAPPDGGFGAPSPTCQQIPFSWPPGGNATDGIAVSITPTPG
jgi:hypothetical protein